MVPVAEASVAGRLFGVDLMQASMRHCSLTGRVVDGEVLARSVDRQHRADTILLVNARQTAPEVDG